MNTQAPMDGSFSSKGLSYPEILVQGHKTFVLDGVEYHLPVRLWLFFLEMSVELDYWREQGGKAPPREGLLC